MLTTEPVDAYDSAAWQSFAVAVVGAAAALAGLLVVACSININRVIELPSVVSRMAASLALFTGVLTAGTVLLVPGQDRWVAGIELAAVGGVMAAATARNHGLRAARREYRRNALGAAVLAVISSLLVVAAGVLCAARAGGGLYWLFPGVVVAFSVGLFNAWVALVEILR
ncbi:hypothetical protein [Actinoplanes subtropicus]|uniref:hypothetical protein n=1 Tax=Actinoplanes subtropicus TaxID=543632 RepID=UPI0004C465E4|nr:hypothetical protein [Actinoplanes subtropicus]